MKLKDFIYGFIIIAICVFIAWVEGVEDIIAECKNNPEYLRLILLVLTGVFVSEFFSRKFKQASGFLNKQIFYGVIITVIYLIMLWALYNFLLAPLKVL